MHSAIAENLGRIKDRIAGACERTGRSPAEVTLIAITKSVGVEEVQFLQSMGVTHFGENRVRSGESKIASLREGVVWHMIGNIQRRKAKAVCTLFDVIDSVDRVELAVELARHAPGDKQPFPVLLEVNVSGEVSKHGFSQEALLTAIDQINAMSNLKLEGLMTMAPFHDDAENVRPVFAALRELANRYGLPRISMGMSNDFEVAIEEGATEVRIGTALFEGM
ncbi:MAG: YggS family pyridoxal phosphate-dependent enzyme [Candidatus Hydrogenedentes bacterium]|nr:YggS family pyridoxal phosphate-dependent enzyme [Candidatus Hydrogenedentota bacterium]